ncbi:MAG: translation initiation factor IF-2, partial [Candidatus Marinimicrobia bacterium]|nr:translation initiation factor IF-2 [Candidatus Neomarinimicrobiota bacterium]
LLELKANPKTKARGIIVEAKLDKGFGPLGTLLVQKGTLRIGDPFICGSSSGKVRALLNERGQRVEFTSPSVPVQVLGFDSVPTANDYFAVLDEERDVKKISSERQRIKREKDFRKIKLRTLDEISLQIKEGKLRELSIIIKGDADGSVEALSDSLLKLSTEEVVVNIIHKGVGAINESDVMLATASNAIIIGFQVRPVLGARQLAEKEEIDIRLYSVIYHAIAEVRDALEGLLTPEKHENILGVIDVRETFKVPKIGMVAGCFVVDGRIKRSDKVRLIRDDVVIYDGTLASLRRFKDDVREVQNGYECGIGIENFNDIKVGDQIEAYEIVETKRTLEV